MENEKQYRTLIISNKPPYPVIDGGCYAMSKFEQLLRNVTNELYYFSVSTHKHPFTQSSLLPNYWELNNNYFNSVIDTKVKPKHVAGFLSGSSLRANRFYDAHTLQSIIKVIQDKKIEVVIFESIYAAVYLDEIKKITGIKVFIRSHNIEHHIWQQFAKGLKGLKKSVLNAENERLKKLEDYLLKTSDGNIFISENDENYYLKNSSEKRSITLPVQLGISKNISDTPHHPLRLFHIGAMDWLPNVEGVEYFIKEVFPAIRNLFPEVELHLAGKAMPHSFHQYASNYIFIHGEVKDAGEFMQQNDVLIVPLLSGSGIRIKILEAMSYGKPVITTHAGIQGINATHQHEILLANSTEEWLAAIEYVNRADHYKNIIDNAIAFLQQHYSEAALQKKYINFIKRYTNN